VTALTAAQALRDIMQGDVPMTRQDLIDIASDAMSDAQDMDTTITDLAKAAVDAVMPFVVSVDGEIKDAQELLRRDLHAKGYERGDVSMIVNYIYSQPWHATIWLGAKGRHKQETVTATTFPDLVAAVNAKIADLPAVWTDEQVAATLGIAA
jgi:hypothetical protein